VGSSLDGQGGCGRIEVSLVPQLVSFFDNSSAATTPAKILCGGNWSMAITESKDAYFWATTTPSGC